MTLPDQSFRPATLTNRDTSTSLVERCVFIGLLCTIVMVPFWLGSNRAVAWDVNASVFGALFVVYEANLLVTGQPHPVHPGRLWLPIACFLCLVTWILVQAATWTPSSWHNAVWGLRSEVLGHAFAGSLSFDRELTYLALLRLLTCGAAVWLALQFGRSADRARHIVATVALAGLGYAAYGLIAFFLLPDTILWFPKPAYHESLTSTFINRNSYATYAGIGLVCALTLGSGGLSRAVRSAGRSISRRMLSVVASLSGPAGGWFCAAAVIALALALSASRAGILSSFAGVLALFGLLFARDRQIGIVLVNAVLGTLLVLGAVLIFGDTFAERLSYVGNNGSDRLAIYALTWLSILDAKWTGYGYGTFQAVFPFYQDGSVSDKLFYDKAHNTYLEVMQGLGLPMAAVFLGMVLWFVVRCLIGTIVRRSPTSASIAGVATSILVGLHALVDFSLQIQAVTLTWLMLIGAGTAQSWSTKTATRSRSL